MRFEKKRRLQRAIAAGLALIMAAGPFAPAAYAAPIPIADKPLISSGGVSPNVMFTFDNSFSMGYPWVSNYLNHKLRNKVGSGGIYEAPASPFPEMYSADVAGTNLPISNDPSVYSPDVNKLYYDPAKRYRPGVRWDGTELPNANPTYALNEPYQIMMGSDRVIFSEGVDLTSWCAPHSAGGGGYIALTWLHYQRDQGKNPPDMPSLYGTAIPGTVKPAYSPGTFYYKYPNGTYCVWAIGTHAMGNPGGLRHAVGKGAVANYAFYYRYVNDPSNTIWSQDANGNPIQRGCDGRPEHMRMEHCFRRTDILPWSRGGSDTYPASAARTDCTTPGSPTGCTYAEEIQNFANYWSYHRTRSVAMKSHLGRAFAALPTTNSSLRIGFNSTNGPIGAYNDRVTNPDVAGGYRTWVDVAEWNDAQKKAFFDAFYSVGPDPAGLNQLRRAYVKVNEYLRGKAAGATDPQRYSCQPNMHLIATDTPGWQDGDQEIRDAMPTGLDKPYAGVNGGDLDGFAQNPYASRARASIDVNRVGWSLADLAMFYASKDLRDASQGNCTGTIAGVDLCADNVVTSAKNNATFNHIRTSVIGVGFEGRPYRSDYETSTDPADFINKVKAGTDNWPLGGTLELDYTGTAYNHGWKARVDDYWHAAVNGRGTYFNPRVPEDLTQALKAALSDLAVGSPASASGSVVSTPIIAAGQDAFSFGVKFFPSDWSGDVYRRRIDPNTGEDVLVDDWNARVKLNALAAGTGWDQKRKIVTLDAAGAKVPFRYDRLSAAQQGTLDTNAPTSFWGSLSAAQKALFGSNIETFRKGIVDFVRGDKSREQDGAGGGVFRKRDYLLGSIVGSEAVYVQKPVSPLSDSTNPGYSAFKAAQESRAPMLYVGANDGMLHAFDATTGEERWAYVPRNLYRNDAAGLAATSFPVGGTPGYNHKYLVDGTPTVVDVDLNKTQGSGTATPDWRTILVAGLNKGGNAIYALDVTAADDVSTATNEATVAANKVLWEFDGNTPGTSSAEVGYTFGKPIVAKTRAWGWVVIAASGYNNADGKGYVFVLNARTGALLHKFTTNTGSGATPSGLAKLAAYSANFADGYVDQVYGADLLGNLWRFDLSPETGPTTNAGVKLATLTAPDGTAQPVTTRPRIEIDRATSRRIVFVGTGKYLDQSDVDPNDAGARQIQSMYAIPDGDRLTMSAAAQPLRRADLSDVAGSVDGIAGRSGWYENFEAGEKVLVDPRADSGAIIYTASKASEDPCSAGVSSRLFARTFMEAQSVLLTSGNARRRFVAVAEGIVKNDTVSVRGNIMLRITNARGEGKTVAATFGTAPNNMGRVSWREIVSDSPVGE
jgi:type IV pilus assembly protein PilY1